MQEPQLATLFHEAAWPILREHGFELQNDTEKPVGRPGFGVSTAKYRTAHGFYLEATFDPFDGQSASLKCGRNWEYSSGRPGHQTYSRLSNTYCSLARAFGYDLPNTYVLLQGSSAIGAIDTMLNDLKASLAQVLMKVTLAHLIAIEEEPYGCQWIEEICPPTAGSFELNKISDFPG